MKKKRQQRIIEIVTERSLQTQDEIASILRSEGFEVTQATVSRDIKELRLIKVLGRDGNYCYGKNESGNGGPKGYSIIQGNVKSVERAMNIVVVKCMAGTANAVCAEIDGKERLKPVGTLAGDDTIFIVGKNEEEAENIKNEIITLSNN